MQEHDVPAPVVLFGGIYERDIDLLLVIELATGPALATWFVSAALGRPVGHVDQRVARGVPSSDGESDIRIEVGLGDTLPVCILVENKITAGFQPRQVERYAERAGRERASGGWSKVVTVLLAAEVYLRGGSRGFDCAISYEQLSRALASDPPSRRIEVVRGLLEGAVRKAREGYDRVVDEPVTRFWRSYWETCQREFPGLRMPEPGGRPSKSSFVRFEPPGLPVRAELIHKLRKGGVDLQIRSCHPDDLRRKVGALIEPDMRVIRAGGSAAVRLEVPTCNAGIPIEDQVETVRSGLAAAQRLFAWGAKHASALQGLVTRTPPR